MTFESANYSLDEPTPIRLTTLVGSVVTLVVEAIDTEPSRLRLDGVMDVDQWTVVDQEGAFHLDLDGDELAGGDADGRIHVELVLRAPIFVRYDDIEGVIDELFGDDPTPLHQSEAWLLASAMQDVTVPEVPDATSTIGFRTQFADPLL